MTTKSNSRTTRAKTTVSQKTEEQPSVTEYVAKNSGAVFMLMQSGITVYDEVQKTIREIRYCEREPSVYKDEQSESSVKTPVIFRMGRLFVPIEKPNLYKYLELHPGNEKNGGNLFSRVNKEKKAEIKIDDDFLIADAISLVREKSLDDLLAVAMSFDIDTDRSVAEVKHDLLQKAKKNPKVFIQSFDNPVVSMKAKIKQAQNYNIISLNEDSVRWTDTNKVIITVPAGKDPLDTFVRYCLTEAASPVVSELDSQLSK
jgi:hypothetical protein